MTAPKSLIINRAHQAPDQHWQDISGQLQIVEGRRPSAYEIFDTRNNTRRTEELEPIDVIRQARFETFRTDTPERLPGPGVE
ncbi:MAG: hypothetical protein LC637_03325 [Xanthomonadaceae bacterium]|nr:hypothetical protein [Xanthomonadaceae bacterium]